MTFLLKQMHSIKANSQYLLPNSCRKNPAVKERNSTVLFIADLTEHQQQNEQMAVVDLRYYFSIKWG